MLPKPVYVLLFVMVFKTAKCANILAIASMPTYSHNVFFRPIWKALADRGHEITVLTTDPMPEPYPNIKEINWHFVYQRKKVIADLDWTPENTIKIYKAFGDLIWDVTQMQLEHPEVRKMRSENYTGHFDLVIAEIHNPYMFGFAHRFKCPLIGISSTEISSAQHALFGNPTHPLMYPNVFGSHHQLTFFSRVLSVTAAIYLAFSSATSRAAKHRLLQTYFGPDVPDVDALTKSATFVFLNVHPTFNRRPLSSKFIPIGGGVHIEPPKALPLALQEFLDKSVHGVVYFSLGTNVNVQQYPRDFVNKTVEAFRELPYQFVWKSALNLADVPDNVKVMTWVPQQDLLRHKNVKAFITQGGLHSKEESIIAEVPMIVIPFISDQNLNAQDAEEKGIAIKLDKNTFSKGDLKSAIKEIVENPRYKSNVIKISRLMRDQPMSALEKAVWYIEYAIRNRDLINTPEERKIPWYQYYFLDIACALSLFLYVFVYLGYKIALYIGQILYKRLIKYKKD